MPDTQHDHPLGDIDGTSSTTTATVEQPSIVDTILNLDDFLAADVRLAEKTARFCTKPELEARIEDLHAELDALTDNDGRPLATDDDLAGAGRSASVVNAELVAAQREYATAMRSVRMRQMDEDDWTAFQARHKATINDGPPYPVGFYEDLIVRTAVAPKFTAAKLQAFRKKVGHPSFNELAQTAWAVNTSSGVSVPKSPLSSAVQRHLQRG
jgi:hypothetical protein